MMQGQALRLLLEPRFVCPRCGRCPLDRLEGDSLTPVCTPCWTTITNGGEDPVPDPWKWPIDGGPELPPESAGFVLGVHT